MRKYNLIVIGAGPGGYVAAIEAAKLGQKVAVIGGGGIGFDVTVLLTEPPAAGDEKAQFLKEWGIDQSIQKSGGLSDQAHPKSPRRQHRDDPRDQRRNAIQPDPRTGLRKSKRRGDFHRPRLQPVNQRRLVQSRTLLHPRHNPPLHRPRLHHLPARLRKSRLIPIHRRNRR